MKLDEKVVLVTGGSRGIGAASAHALAAAGAHVVLGARGRERLEQVAAAIRAGGGRASAVELDVTSDASVAAAEAAVIAAHGHVDVVVNNAGNGGQLGLWLDEPSKLRDMMEVHVFGMERVTRAFLPAMLARGSGTVVNVVSAVAWAPMAAAAGYCAAKAAVLAFSEALRGELAGRGVDVLIFGPGHTSTESAWPLRTGQLLSPEEVAEDLVRTIARRRPLFVSGMSNRTLVRLKRFAPGLAQKIITGIGLDALERARELPSG